MQLIANLSVVAYSCIQVIKANTIYPGHKTNLLHDAWIGHIILFINIVMYVLQAHWPIFHNSMSSLATA